MNFSNFFASAGPDPAGALDRGPGGAAVNLSPPDGSCNAPPRSGGRWRGGVLPRQCSPRLFLQQGQGKVDGSYQVRILFFIVEHKFSPYIASKMSYNFVIPPYKDNMTL